MSDDHQHQFDKYLVDSIAVSPFTNLRHAGLYVGGAYYN